ncbi:MAG: hypothetical protein OEY11_10670 [Gammaproteobacteria bacterium]|nr:hypothetical protein [Gammaproteobacteria bacterium]
MKAPVVVIGLGEIGAVFARGFLKSGHPVFPLCRGDSLLQFSSQIEAPAAVIVAVGEADLEAVLKQMPQQWLSVLVLLQNELLPRDWASLACEPTVISIWFEKKKGQDSKVIIPSPVHGPLAALVQDALASIEIAVKIVADQQAMLSELVVKNLYILTSNIAGLEVGGNVGDLWHQHRELAEAVIDDVLLVQEKLAAQRFDRNELITLMLVAFNGDPLHQCMGRSAPARLQRTLDLAADFGIELKKLRSISVATE